MPMESNSVMIILFFLLALLAVFPVEGYLKVVLFVAIAGILAVFNRKIPTIKASILSVL
jgi:hypothetical protein